MPCVNGNDRSSILETWHYKTMVASSNLFLAVIYQAASWHTSLMHLCTAILRPSKAMPLAQDYVVCVRSITADETFAYELLES